MERFYRQILGLRDAQLIRRLAAASQWVFFQKGALLFRTGEICNDIYFLQSGVIRNIMLNADGQELTDGFVFSTGEVVMTSFNRLEPDRASCYTIEALEDSTFLRLPVAVAIQAARDTPEITQMHNRILLSEMKKHREIKLALYQMSAVERYQWFLKQYPGLAGRLPDRYIASFLGMKPVTLSRLRHSLRAGQA